MFIINFSDGSKEEEVESQVPWNHVVI